MEYISQFVVYLHFCPLYIYDSTKIRYFLHEYLLNIKYISVGKVRFDDLHGMKSYKGYQAYGQSKICNILFTLELQQRLQGKDIYLVERVFVRLTDSKHMAFFFRLKCTIDLSL
jgi:hypothetical protein